MRLLKLEESGEIILTKDVTYHTTPYAILSHTWGDDDDEVNFDDLKIDGGKTKPGYRKLQFCGQQAARDGLEYFWIDTCCIDKSSTSELSEAINSMFRWYREAARCYAYLTDISTEHHTDLRRWEPAFVKSRWFTRGWTLQELIAPPSVEFFCSNGNRLGDKKSLEKQLHKITGIPISALRGSPLPHFSFEERVLWARGRETTRTEDLAYSLLGIFDIFIAIIYGEGKQNAFRRLNREWKHRLEELSIFSRVTSDNAKRTAMLKLTLERHSERVLAVAFSPDSRSLVSASGDSTLRYWDAATGALQKTVERYSTDYTRRDKFRSIIFSPDLRLLATTSWDKEIRLWDVATWTLEHVLKEHSFGLNSVAFSPNSKLLASWSWGNRLRLWDVATGALQQEFEMNSLDYKSVAFSPDQTLVAAGAGDGNVWIWNVATGGLHRTFKEATGTAWLLAISTSSRLLASGSRYHTVRLWDITTGMLQHTLKGHMEMLWSLSFSPDSTLLISTSEDETMRLWDAATGVLQQTFEAQSDAVEPIAFSPDSKLLATASGKTVRLWGATTDTLY